VRHCWPVGWSLPADWLRPATHHDPSVPTAARHGEGRGAGSRRCCASLTEVDQAHCRDATPRLRPTPIADSVFARFFYPPDMIVLAVRWYLRFSLSYRVAVEPWIGYSGRGLDLDLLDDADALAGP
jgi:hypothetical protein